MKKKLYLIPDRKRIEESVELAEKYDAAFEYNDFFLPDILDDVELCEELTAFYKGLGRDTSKDTLHGAFLDITVHSDDEEVRKVSEKRVRQSLDIADRLGVEGVVFHTNTIPNFDIAFYKKNWVQRNACFWKKMLCEYPTLHIYIENMFDIKCELLKELSEEMKTEKRFGVCYDYAHAAVFGDDLKYWTKEMAAYIRHMHINDNDLKADLHLAVGEGKIDWQDFDADMRKNRVESAVLIEVKEIEKQKKSLEYMEKNKIFPF